MAVLNGGKSEIKKNSKRRGPVEGPRRKVATLSEGSHEKELGLPGALSNVLYAIQNQILQLNMPVANAPKLVDNWRRLVGLSNRSHQKLAKSASGPRNSSVCVP